VHNELDCSDDVEILEIYSPAVHETAKVERMPEEAAAAALIEPREAFPRDQRVGRTRAP